MTDAHSTLTTPLDDDLLPIEAASGVGGRDEVVQIGDLSAAVLHIIARYFRGMRHSLSIDEAHQLLEADLCAMPYVGPVRAKRVRQAVLERLPASSGDHRTDDDEFAERWVLGLDESVVMIDQALAGEMRRIRREHLLPAAAADVFGVSVDEARARVEGRAGVDGNAARVLRAWAIVDLVEEGMTLRAISDRFGVTSEGIRKMLAAYGVNVRAAKARRLRCEREDRRARTATVESFVRAHPGITMSELGHVLDLDIDDLVGLARGVRHLVLSPVDEDELTRLADRRAGIIDSLHRAGNLVSPLTGEAFDALVTDGTVPGPGRQIAIIVFGSWVAACEAAGVTPGDTIRPTYDRRWTDDEIDRALVEYLAAPDSPGTGDGYEQWASGRDVPSGPLVRSRSFGSWKEATRRALLVARRAWTNTGDRSEFDGWLLAS
ncbi:MAG: hypothetical protein RLZZ01_2449 [Actinomycetota bacterium]